MVLAFSRQTGVEFAGENAMCKSCSTGHVSRRDFLAVGGAMGAAGLLSSWHTRQAWGAFPQAASPTPKTPPRVAVVFLYPPADVVNAGQLEDSWRGHHWFTWPGNQFEPEQQEKTFTAKIRELSDRLGVAVEFEPQAIYQEAAVAEFIGRTQAKQVDAVLVVNFWNTFSPWAARMAAESAPTAIVYHSLGSNHQLPPNISARRKGCTTSTRSRTGTKSNAVCWRCAPRRCSPKAACCEFPDNNRTPTHDVEKRLNVDIVTIPAAEFNAMFDAIEPDDAMVRAAMEVKNCAARVTDVSDEYFVEAMRAHRAVARSCSGTPRTRSPSNACS